MKTVIKQVVVTVGSDLMGNIAHQTISKISTQRNLEDFKTEYMYIIRRCFGKDFHFRNSSDESLLYMVHGFFFPLGLFRFLGLF